MGNRFTAVFALAAHHWGPVTAAAGLGLGLAALKGVAIASDWPSSIFIISLWLSISLIAWLILSCAFVIFLPLALPESSVEIRPVRRNELESLLPFYDQLIRAARPAINQIKALYNANKKSILILEIRSQRGLAAKSRIAGFCSILPVSSEAASLLGKEQLNGLSLNKQHICTPRQTPHALYIGSIGGKGARAKAQILGYVLGQIDDSEKRGVKCVYTRPVTKDGLRLAKQYGFTPVGSNVGTEELNRLYKLKLPRQGRRAPRMVPNIGKGSSHIAGPEAASVARMERSGIRGNLAGVILS